MKKIVFLLGFIMFKMVKKLVHTVLFIRFDSQSFKKDSNDVQILSFTVLSWLYVSVIYYRSI